MNVVLLTTDTTHHLAYAHALHQAYPLRAIFLELKQATHPFPTHHPFEDLRDAHERATMLHGFGGGFKDLAETRFVESMNDRDAVAQLRRAAPDVALVFGTGRLRPEVLAVPRVALNLHGGDPERYRGLDSHLWALYHDDWTGLVTTLHHMDAELDTGDIVGQQSLVLPPGTRLHHLRGINTRACIDLSLRALATLAGGEPLAARPQARRGRYYSAMPAVLKDVVLARFERRMPA